MITEKQISEIIEKAIEKCSITISEMHNQLSKWDNKQITSLLKYASRKKIREDNLKDGTHMEDIEVEDSIDTLLEYYDNILEEEDKFNIERQIFDNLTKTQRDNILEHLIDFDEYNYHRDDEVGYPNDERGVSEAEQESIQEEKGYTEEFKQGVYYWTHGFYEEINNYIKDKTSSPFDFKTIPSAEALMDYIINDSPGLHENTVLFRGGHWDIGTQIGDVVEIPMLNSTSYSKASAYDLGIDSEPDKNHYMITFYCDEGTKGAMINAPSLSSTFPEHEYLLPKGTKFICTDVNDNADPPTASVKIVYNP